MRVEEAGRGLLTVKLNGLMLPVAVYDLKLARDSFEDAIRIHSEQGEHELEAAARRKLESVVTALEQCDRADPEGGCSITAPTWLVRNALYMGASVSIEELVGAIKALERTSDEQDTSEQEAAAASASELVSEWVRTLLAAYHLSPG